MKEITSTAALQEFFVKFHHMKEVHIYINGEILAEEGDVSDRDEVVGGLNDYKSSSGGESFDDSDSEYEYKMDEDKDEEGNVGAENDDLVFEGEELVENVVEETDGNNNGKDNKGKERVEESDAEGLTVEDTEFEDLSGDDNIVWSDDELNSNKGSDADEEKGESFPGHNARGCPSKSVSNDPIPPQKLQVRRKGIQGHNVSNEPIPDASSQVPPSVVPQKLQVKSKCRVTIEEPDVGHVPAAPPLIRKLKNKRAPQQAATAPTMFAQFQQCQKGVKLQEPAPFVNTERGGMSTNEQGSSGSTPSIVKGGKRFVTMANLSNVVNQLNKGK
ncbi:hypothetical protein Salat_2899700 [Sesamum alatum]|uniref:Uncharacterized protein n=1 Tax=Sesamum alatum TaxID=300844 RepID=A0AAE1XIJ7_9LAMI|nr:hypothetical protein Salat_2899700 [Sesamum alatum]